MSSKNKPQNIFFSVEGVNYHYKHPAPITLSRMILKAKSEEAQYPNIGLNLVGRLAGLYVVELKGKQRIKLTEAYLDEKGVKFTTKFFQTFAALLAGRIEAEKDVLKEKAGNVYGKFA